jgi:hypothetical protein
MQLNYLILTDTLQIERETLAADLRDEKLIALLGQSISVETEPLG